MLMGLFWFLQADFAAHLRRLAQNRVALIMLLYYLGLLLSSLYSPSPKEAQEELLSKIPFLAWPILLGTLSPKRQVALPWLLRWWVIAVTLALLAAFAGSLVNYLACPDPAVFYFQELIRYSRVPPHYFGLFVNFSYALLLYGLLHPQEALFPRAPALLMVILLAFSLIFIAVRMQYLVFGLVNAAILFGYFRKRYSPWSALLLLLLGLVLFLGMTWSFSGSRQRLRDTFNELRSFREVSDDKQTNPRKYLWLTAGQVVQERPLLGTGLGAENPALHRKLAQVQIQFWNGSTEYYLHEKKYNYHSAYLQTLAAQGLLGLLLLLALFVFGYRYGVRNCSMPAAAKLFLLIAAVSFLTESMLQRQAGVLFFSFFYALLLARTPPAGALPSQKHP